MFLYEKLPHNPLTISSLVAVPVGWHQLKNVATGHILHHTYPSSPPLLIPADTPQKTSNYRETWAAQWAVFSGKQLNPESSKWSYYMRNRLTGGSLCLQAWHNMPHLQDYGSVNTWVTSDLIDFKLDWQRNWQLAHWTAGNLLGEAVESTPLGGHKVVANSRDPDPCRTWVFLYVSCLCLELCGCWPLTGR
jgi:hypothetical protein